MKHLMLWRVAAGRARETAGVQEEGEEEEEEEESAASQSHLIKMGCRIRKSMC